MGSGWLLYLHVDDGFGSVTYGTGRHKSDEEKKVRCN